MVVVRSHCRHRRIPRSVVAAIVAPSVIVSSATDPPCPPLPRSSPAIGASGEPWTTTTTAPPCRASRTSTESRHLLCARSPCSSPSSSLSSSSSQNALPKRAYPPASASVSSSSSVATPLLSSPSRSSCPMLWPSYLGHSNIIFGFRLILSFQNLTSVLS